MLTHIFLFCNFIYFLFHLSGRNWVLTAVPLYFTLLANLKIKIFALSH